MKRPPLLTWQEGLILIAFGTLLMVSAPSFAQTVLTVNGQCVPTTCSNNPPPIVCTPPAVLQNGVCVTPITPPVIPPAGVQLIEKSINLPLSSASYKGEIQGMGKNQQVAYKFRADDVRGRIIVIQNSKYSISVSISANPHDYGPLDATQGQRGGLIDTLGNGGGGDKTFGIPATFNAPSGFIYVNVRWPVWNNFPPNGKLVNYALDDSGTFVIRKDA